MLHQQGRVVNPQAAKLSGCHAGFGFRRWAKPSQNETRDAKFPKAVEPKKPTLTNLYNRRPAWLVQAHAKLDEAVAAAYGWPADIGEEEALKKLLDLNLERSGRA